MPDRLKAYSFLLFSKLEGAMTSGMVHLGDRLGLFRALAAAPAAGFTSQELADAAGLQERWVREWAHNQAAAKLLELVRGWRGGRAVLDDARGGRRPRRRRASRVRHGHVPPASADDAGARADRRVVPHRHRPRLRRVRPRGRRRHRAELRSVVPQLPRACRAARPRRRGRATRGGREGDRHRVWCRPRAADDGRGVSELPVRRLRHLRVRASAGASRHARSGDSTTPGSTRLKTSASRRTDRSTS